MFHTFTGNTLVSLAVIAGRVYDLVQHVDDAGFAVHPDPDQKVRLHLPQRRHPPVVAARAARNRASSISDGAVFARLLGKAVFTTLRCAAAGVAGSRFQVAQELRRFLVRLVALTGKLEKKN